MRASLDRSTCSAPGRHGHCDNPYHSWSNVLEVISMLTTLQAFEKFRQKLELSDTEKKDASRRQTDVRECIRSTFDIRADFLSGSYRRHTKTKPLKDVDVVFVLAEKEKWRRDKPPIEMLRAFEGCLNKRY